ncbi:hypothetical protein [Afifella sp. IM 167]|uniref:hypothetical protein n=1 Tax=Afifella sp. IM 167 TaxID=2033586 RepID=UPI001CCCB4C0|nr:hypothetical protein [Afifella sp. IM 167]MBZ8132464.1 hypothetical protein [Afifella sp. IM 167]
MLNATLYQTVLLELYERFSGGSLPAWVIDGLVEEGLASSSETGEIVLATSVNRYRLSSYRTPRLVAAGA